MSIIIAGKRIATPFESISWLDDAQVAPRITHVSPRTRRVRAIVLHTIHGKAGPIKAGFKPSTRAEAQARYQANTARAASWDATLDTDGTLLWQNDPVSSFSWHATAWNPFSLGIECVQDDDGTLYDGQLQTLVRVVDFLTGLLKIQRQIPWGDSGLPRGVVARLDEHGAHKGDDYVGVAAHYMNTTNRGLGDTQAPFEYLKRAGYECFDLADEQDLQAWKTRQMAMGMPRAEWDGVPLDRTVAELTKRGYPLGLWVRRPDDALIASL